MDGGVQAVVELELSGSGQAVWEVVRAADGQALPELSATVTISKDPQRHRFVLRGQLPMDGLFLRLRMTPGSKHRGAINAWVEREQIARLHRDVHEGRRNQSGITFDALPMD